MLSMMASLLVITKNVPSSFHLIVQVFSLGTAKGAEIWQTDLIYCDSGLFLKKLQSVKMKVAGLFPPELSDLIDAAGLEARFLLGNQCGSRRPGSLGLRFFKVTLRLLFEIA